MKTEEFVKLMTGHFDNAQHVNTVCNDKINNIPEDFHGIFIVEDKNTFSYDSIHFLRREMLDFTAFPVFFVTNLLLVQRKKYYFNRATVSRNCSIVL